MFNRNEAPQMGPHLCSSTVSFVNENFFFFAACTWWIDVCMAFMIYRAFHFYLFLFSSSWGRDIELCDSSRIIDTMIPHPWKENISKKTTLLLNGKSFLDVLSVIPKKKISNSNDKRKTCWMLAYLLLSHFISIGEQCGRRKYWV